MLLCHIFSSHRNSGFCHFTLAFASKYKANFVKPNFRSTYVNRDLFGNAARFWLFEMPMPRGSWGKGETWPKPKIAIVQKPFYVYATCRLPYEALVEAINAFYHKTKASLSIPQGVENVSVVCFPLFAYTWKLNYSLSMRLFLMLYRVGFVWYMHFNMCRPLVAFLVARSVVTSSRHRHNVVTTSLQRK